jgi:DNA-binding GntR family transcriptional regulator
MIRRPTTPTVGDSLARISPIATLRTVEDTVTRELRTLILDGQIEAGVRLRYRDLAGKLGVSVTPVRIAVRDLAKEGLVEVTERGLVRVAPYSIEELEEVYAQRAGLEGLLARRGAPRISQQALEVMNARLARVEQTAGDDTRQDYVDAIWDYRLPCYEAADRPRLLGTVELLVDRCARYNRLTLDDSNRFEGSLEFQRQFGRACELRDGAAAETVIRAAMDWSREYLLARLGPRIGPHEASS